jgi:tape measure domain-containing protein
MSEQVQYTLSLKDLFTGKLRAADDAVNKFEGTLGKAQSAAMNLAGAVGIAFGTAAVVAFGQKMVQAGSQVEDALTGLTTLLKDKAEAQQVINQTMEDAAKTPFAFEGLLAANKALISSGVGAKDARNDVLNLANAIAATGGGDNELQRMVVNLQQISTVGKATAMDIKQFAFAGVNIYKVLADATNQPIEKVKEMEVTYETLTMALQKASQAGGIYENGLINMSENTSVKISALGDGVFKLSAQMFSDLKPAIDSVLSGISRFISVLAAGWNWIMRNKEEIQFWATVLGAAVAPLVAITAATWLLSAAGGALSLVLTGVGTALTFIAANPITVALMVLAGVVVYAYQKFATFRAVLWGVWGTIKEWAVIVSEAFQNVWKVIKGVFTLDASMIADGYVGNAKLMVNAGMRLAQGFKEGYNNGMKDFAADQAKKTVAAPKTIQSAAQIGGKKTAENIVPTKSETKGAQGQKAMTMTVNIGSLIKDFKISTTNIQEGTAKVRELVAQALINATNDSQLIAGQ